MIRKIRQLKENKVFALYLINTLWMVFEYGLKIVSALFVSVYVARYLGPEQFGVLSYALAIAAVFMVMSRLGMESILVRELSRYPVMRQAYLGAGFRLMAAAAVIGLLVLGVLSSLIAEDRSTRIYIWVISSGMIFQSFFVVDYNFQAQVNAKKSSIAKSLALIAGAGLKIALVWWQADILYFAIAYFCDQVFIAIMLVITHLLYKGPSFIFVFNAKVAKSLLVSAWPMVMSSLSVVMYTRLDQFMIGKMVGYEQLGIYAAAVRIYEGWIMLPYIISVSLLPAIIKMRSVSVLQYRQSFIKLYAIVFWSGMIVAFAIILVGKNVVEVVYGAQYSEAYPVLVVVMLSASFASFGSVSGRYLAIEGLEKKIAFRAVCALAINAAANYIFIPLLGIVGAAWSTLIALLVTNYLFNFFDKETADIWAMQNSGIFLGGWGFGGK